MWPLVYIWIIIQISRTKGNRPKSDEQVVEAPEQVRQFPSQGWHVLSVVFSHWPAGQFPTHVFKKRKLGDMQESHLLLALSEQVYQL